MIEANMKNLQSDAATGPVTRWLLSAVKNSGTMTYGEIASRLESECGFKTIFPIMAGKVAGACEKAGRQA